MKYLFIFITSVFILVGCGGGGDSDGSIYPRSETITIYPAANLPKLYYLPSFGLNGTLQYHLDTTATEGNVSLIDQLSGLISYQAKDENTTSDQFLYTVSDNSTGQINVTVQLSIGAIPVTINGTEENNFSSNLPLVIVDTGDQSIPDEPKIKGGMAVIEPDPTTGRTSPHMSAQYSGHIAIEIRGSSSQIYPKKQYSVDTETWNGEDDDIPLLGMPAEHKWILYAPYADKSLMRNYLAYHKSREINSTQYYAVRSHFVELLVREEDHYRYDGVYVLMEKIKRDANRLDLAKLTETENQLPDITGGYIFKQDGDPDPDEDIFAGITGTRFIYVYPKSSKITEDQKFYIENYVQTFEYALDANDFNDTASSNYYGNFISEEDFIVHFLSREFFMDVDTWLFSEYLHKDKDAKLALSAVWDFNAGMGNNDFRLNGTTQGWVYDIMRTDYPEKALRKWLDRLMSDPAFRQKVKDKWSSLRSTIWSDANLTVFIDNTKAMLDESAARNFQRWPEVLSQYVWPNRMACDDGGIPVYCPTFERAVNEHLKSWLLERAVWIDTNLTN